MMERMMFFFHIRTVLGLSVVRDREGGGGGVHTGTIDRRIESDSTRLDSRNNFRVWRNWLDSAAGGGCQVLARAEKRTGHVCEEGEEGNLLGHGIPLRAVLSARKHQDNWTNDAVDGGRAGGVAT